MGELKLSVEWKQLLGDYLQSDEFIKTSDFARERYLSGDKIYPLPQNVFQALNLSNPQDVRVIILGQDPYHGAGQAMGLSFSVPADVKNPPSLQNIFKELEDELGQKSEAELKFSGDLTNWAKQGVLLLNSVLTVEAGKAGSHAGKGWEQFTDQIIKRLSARQEGIVFMLWGNYAKQKLSLIDQRKHLVLSSSHPSPFSAHSGFFGCGHFKKANTYLKLKGKEEIKW